MRELTFGYSPCPNDTFAFHALTFGLVDAPFRVRPVLLDIEELNRRAHDGELELTKLSVGAFAAVGDRYRLLRSGAALGEGVGPLVVTRPRKPGGLPRAEAPTRSEARGRGERGGPPPKHNVAPNGGAGVTDSSRTVPDLAEAVRGRVAIPGRETTAYRLLRLAAPALGPTIEMRYDRILRAVETGEVDAGLIIHESRFTYQDHGLVKAAGGSGRRGCRCRSPGSAPGTTCLTSWWRRPSGRSAPPCSTRSTIRRRAATTCRPTRRRWRPRSSGNTSRST